jgi:hypothetical protein
MLPMTLTTTRYPKSIKSPSSGVRVLKPGSSNAKLGFRITSKVWRNKRLYSLTLTERDTCPRSCHHWDDCYGNNMPFAHRFDTVGLMERLAIEIPELVAKHPAGIVIRLHVLGDFYSTDYVAFWERMLLEYPTLCVFGYTAREIDSDIGKAIYLLNLRYGERCILRYSRNQSFDTVGQSYAAEESFVGASFDCPEQTGKLDSCASCGLCWTVQKTVRFLSH